MNDQSDMLVPCGKTIPTDIDEHEGSSYRSVQRSEMEAGVEER